MPLDGPTSPRRRLLPATQTALLALITEPVPHPFTPAADTLVVSDGRASADERVQVYAYMYRARLAEALASQFPRLARMLGTAAFEGLTFAYVTEHPSRHPSLRFLGEALPEWLERRHRAELSDLARLEWARGDVFDAVDEPVLTVDALRAWPLDEFTRLPIRLTQAHRIVTVDFAIAACWEQLGEVSGAPDGDQCGGEDDGIAACEHGGAAPLDVQIAVAEQAAGESLLVWRQGAAVYHRVLAEGERTVLELAAAGTTFGAICDALSSRPPEEASAQAFAWLWSWTTAELLIAP
jgi:hypothetical protein